MELAQDTTLLYKVRVGSHAYGMNTATSDEDFAGIFVPSLDYFFGLKAFDQQIEQTEERDTTLYSLRKYANLAVANNPNVMELLFVDDSDVIFIDPALEKLRAIRHVLLSQRCAKTYLGYAQAQLHRIRTHQKWIGQEFKAMEILEPLAREGKISKEWVAWRFGENLVTRLQGPWTTEGISMWNYPKSVFMDTYLEQLKGLGIVCPVEDDPEFWAEHRSKGQVYHKHKYDAAKKQRDQYVTWMAERNPARHEMEVKFGYDTKHAAHLVRLLRSGYEILTTGELNVRRPDAAELLAIRQGAWTYEEVCKYADDMILKVQGLTEFAVPERPDAELVNKTIIDITREVLSRTKLNLDAANNKLTTGACSGCGCLLVGRKGLGRQYCSVCQARRWSTEDSLSPLKEQL